MEALINQWLVSAGAFEVLWVSVAISVVLVLGWNAIVSVLSNLQTDYEEYEYFDSNWMDEEKWRR